MRWFNGSIELYDFHCTYFIFIALIHDLFIDFLFFFINGRHLYIDITYNELYILIDNIVTNILLYTIILYPVFSCMTTHSFNRRGTTNIQGCKHVWTFQYLRERELQIGYKLVPPTTNWFLLQKIKLSREHFSLMFWQLKHSS